MVRTLTDDDTGLKVLYQPLKRDSSGTASASIDIVAIHGIGAHPDDTWTKNVGSAHNQQWVNWLSNRDMLPSVVPTARILRYGYESAWFGREAMRQKTSVVAHRLLISLRRARKEFPQRPLIFIAHCFGGLVILKTLLEAKDDKDEWPGIFISTTGLVFFGTPFRGAEGMSQNEMLAAARREYDPDQVQPEVLKILEPGNEFLQELVDQFGKTRKAPHKARVACFYKLKSSNVGAIVGKEERTRFVVSESSGCLDLSNSTEKYSSSRTHFNMNKFGKPSEEDFQTVCEVLERMAKEAQEVVQARLQYLDQRTVSSLRWPQGISPLEHRINELSQWLFAPDPSSNYRKAKKQRQAGTGLWFLEGEQYAQFKNRTARFMWLYGIPGCGKSVLSSTILDDLFQFCQSQDGWIVAYFYFDFSDPQKQTPEAMVKSIITQLVRKCSIVPYSLDALFSQYQYQRSSQQPSVEVYLGVLKDIIQSFTRIYLVLDALDECGSRTELTSLLTVMAEWRIETLQLLVTSRKERDIEHCLEDLVEENYTVSLQSDIVDSDIQLYIRERLCKDKDLRKWRKDGELQDEIEKTLLKGAHGMFRWAACQLDALAKCRNRTTLRRSLATLPPTLDETYERILRSIDKKNDEDAMYAVRILHWLSFSARPLLLEEMAEAAAIDPERKTPFDRNEVLEDPSEVLDICSSLVILTTISSNEISKRYDPQPRKCEAVILAHYSVQEYLSSDRCLQGPMARYSTTSSACHAFIASSCLGYLHHLDDADFFSTHRVEDVKLGVYSSQFWTHHARDAPTDERIIQPAVALLSRSNAAYCNWIRIHDPDKSWKGSDTTRDPQTIPEPLYYTCLEGLAKVASHLITIEGADVNAQGGRFGNALQAASSEGHDKVVEVLLAKGADVNAQGGLYGNALQAASLGGYDKVVEVLLAEGADVNAQGGDYGNALQAASLGGHDKVVEVLLDKGADVNAQGGDYGNALQAASSNGHDKIVEMLLTVTAERVTC